MPRIAGTSARSHGGHDGICQLTTPFRTERAQRRLLAFLANSLIKTLAGALQRC
jgi:hypothetical protein